jgi:hypothetical protein
LYNGKTTNPGAGDNTGAGYNAGDIWINTTANPDQVWIKTAEAGGSAVWVELTGGSGTGVTDGDKGDVLVSSTGTVWTVETIGGNAVAKFFDAKTVDPTSSNNTAGGYSTGDMWSNTTGNKVWIKTKESAGSATWLQISN